MINLIEAVDGAKGDQGCEAHPTHGDADDGAVASVTAVPPWENSASTQLLGTLATAALDKLNRGVVLLTEDGCVAFFNRGFRAIMERADGLGLENHRLRFGSPGVQAAFEAFLAGNRADGSESLVFSIEDPRCGRPYRLLVSKLESGSGFSVFVYEPGGGQRPLPVAVLRHLYRLTPAEAQLTNELFVGKTLAQAANARGITTGTAKVMLKTIFKKCEVGSRAELMLLLSLGPRTL